MDGSRRCHPRCQPSSSCPPPLLTVTTTHPPQNLALSQMGCTCSKPDDEPVVETPSKGEAQQETLQETLQATQQETRPKEEIQGETPSKGQRVRETAILVCDFASIISEASDILKPMKVVSEFIKKILVLDKVSFNLPDKTSLFTKSQRACRR